MYKLKHIEIPRISLARLATPLQPLHRFSQKYNFPTIWLKRDDLTDTLASGNKLRKLEFVVGQALAEGANVLVTCGGIQSNHCRATAAVASRLGLKCHLVLRGAPEFPADGNLMLDLLLGAKTTYVSSEEFQDVGGIFARLEHKYRKAGDRPYCIPLGATYDVGLWGYIAAAEELAADFAELNITPGYIVSATGSGGTAGGLIAGKHLFDLGADIVSFNVCDKAGYFIKQINKDFKTWSERYHSPLPSLPINIIDGYVGHGYGRAEPQVFSMIAELARTEGVILDPVYTAKAFHGLVSELNQGNFADASDIVFIHTGGIYGIFPHKEQFLHNPVIQRKTVLESPI